MQQYNQCQNEMDAIKVLNNQLMDQMEIKSFPTVIIRKFLLFSSPA